MEHRWLTAKEVGEYFGIASKSVYDLIAAGKLPSARIGRLVRIDLRALEAELERQTQGSSANIKQKGGHSK